MKLENFLIKQNSITATLGSFVASHCISDSLVFLCLGIGCKAQMPFHMGAHEFGNNYVSRMGWSEFNEDDFISGDLSKIKSSIMGQLNRFNAGFFPIVISPMVKTIGMDLNLEKYALILEEELGVKIRFVELSGATSDFWEGYNEVIKAFAKTIDWNDCNIEKRSVNIWGYPFDRYEKEHFANVEFLKNTLNKIGINVKAIFLSGTSTKELEEARNAECNIILPFASKMGNFLEKLTGKPSIYTELPIGLTQTEKWLKKIAISLKTKKGYEKAIEISQKEIEKRQDNIEVFKKSFDGINTGLILDLPYIGPISNLLQEVGFNIKFIIIRDRYYGGKPMAEKVLKFYGINQQSIIVEEYPQREELINLIQKNHIELVVGSSYDVTQLIQYTNTFTFGFPSTYTHYKKEDSPFFGFKGYDNFLSLIKKKLN